MWIASEHSNDENMQWSWIRAVEWVGWPLFITQPIVPILLYFPHGPVLLIALVITTFLWRSLIVPFWVSPGLAFAGCYFVKLKFITTPPMAYLLWQRGDTLIAIAALFWPLLGPMVVGWLIAFPSSLLFLTPIGKASQIGLVQKRFLSAIGFRPTEPAAW
jgi:hypothetical protein